MPSAHSTFVIALATSMGMKYGVWSDNFMICLVFSIIIIYDAMNVRYQAVNCGAGMTGMLSFAVGLLLAE